MLLLVSVQSQRDVILILPHSHSRSHDWEFSPCFTLNTSTHNSAVIGFLKTNRVFRLHVSLNYSTGFAIFCICAHRFNKFNETATKQNGFREGGKSEVGFHIQQRTCTGSAMITRYYGLFWYLIRITSFSNFWQLISLK